MMRLASARRDLDVRPAKHRRRMSSSSDVHSEVLATSTNGEWSLDSWRTKPIKQQPYYEDQEKLDAVCAKLCDLPPLVQPSEVDELKRQLAAAGDGERFILQGGDCAERFEDCTSERLQKKLRVIMQMGMIVGWGAQVPLTRIGRVAGQYMKPRSKPTEMIDGREVMAYKGDAINGIGLDDREHNPQRLQDGYFHSAATLNYMRTYLQSVADELQDPATWDASFVKSLRGDMSSYQAILKEIREALDFIHSYTHNSTQHKKTKTLSQKKIPKAEIFTSHEGLVLEFEQAMTREVGQAARPYNLGAHFVWIGDRTRQMDGAHIEYFRGIANPIGCKCGPTTNAAELCELIKAVNPDNEKGKIVLISRFGAGKVSEKLCEIIRTVETAGLNVVWQCDPMHGNTFSTANGTKTRDFHAVFSEVEQTFAAHAACGTVLGGVHFEMCGDDVTECVGGACGLTAGDLKDNYESFCDPRLNWQQSIEMALKMVTLLRKQKATLSQ